MPELPEVETTRRGVGQLLHGHRLEAVTVREPRLRWPVELPEDLPGQVLTGIDRRAKYLLFRFEHGTLIVHLGMSGSLRVLPPDAPYLKHDHVILHFAGGRSLRFHDPRRFGSIHWQPTDTEGLAADDHWLLVGLGPEPFDPTFDGPYLKTRARRRRVAVKSFIMDSRIVVGVGNIYANEALFLAGIRPTVPAGRVTLAGYEALVGRIRHVLGAAIQMGGTTLRDFVNQDGNPGYFKQVLNVYDRAGEPCRVCGALLRDVRLAGRATVFCPKCQKAQGFRLS
ncbi:MAG TPA: bifunctional DNA-formamidopyrimidine glycosylase/DNA-(apurinic or apyrimidinic site) lyase [Pseudomonadales bacterium]